METELTDLIVARLRAQSAQLQQQFLFEHPIKVARHFALDDLLPLEIAEKIYDSFPKPQQMHLLQGFGKIKLKYAHLKEASSLLQAINAAIQHPRVVAVIEEITGIQHQIPDPTGYAGGISALLKGFYINPHIDVSHDVETKRYYRTVNMLYYVSPNWTLSNGGNYELWDEAVENHLVVPNLFNRLVVMETNSRSWHAVSPVLCDEPRCCIFNYFFSEHSPEGKAYSIQTALFMPRPEQKMLRAMHRCREIVLSPYAWLKNRKNDGY